MRYLQDHLERAERNLRHLEDYREAARSTLWNPGLLDERIEAAQQRVADLKRKIEEVSNDSPGA